MYSSTYPHGGHGGHYRSTGSNCPPFPGSFLSPPRPLMGINQRLLRNNSPGFGYNHYGSVATEPSARHVKCGELRTGDVGEVVEIAGRVSNMRSCRFLSIRDETGVTQLVATDERSDLQKRMAKMPLDSYVVVRGEVLMRPENARNKNMATGCVEVLIHEFITVQTKRKSEGEEEDVITERKKTKQKRAVERITTEEIAKAENKAMRSYFAARSHTCGDVSSSVVGKEMVLCGWVHAKRSSRFIVFKDGHGEIQLVTANNMGEMSQLFQDLKLGTVIFVRGILTRRPSGQENPRSPNGNYEISVSGMTMVTRDSPLIEDEIEGSTEETEETTISSFNSSETCDKVPLYNKYALRTYTCGELRSSHVGQTVILKGWIEFIRMNKFFTLRDSYGTTQVLINESNLELNELVSKLSYESVVSITGTVCQRPPSQIKGDQPTGEIEVLASSIELLNKAGVLPFNIREFQKANEFLRLQHRYLDLRFPRMQRNLRMRSSVLMKMREFLINKLGFVEVETPTLFGRTPGGAREFVVPTHTRDHFYSLTQSPQQLKQLLMVGGIDRYFQVARCYRDESTRPDRQPEFTQLDIELSFCDSNDVISLVEDLLQYAWVEPEKIILPFSRLSYNEAIEKYGTDKPDLRFDWQLFPLTDIFKLGGSEDAKININERIKSESFAAYGLVARKGAPTMSSSYKKKATQQLKTSYPLITSLLFSIKDLSIAEKKLGTILGEIIASRIVEVSGVSENDALFVMFGPRQQVLESLGKLRIEFADAMEVDGLSVRSRNDLRFLWITDFPLFITNDEGKLEACHHPFTAPIPEDFDRLFIEPMSVTGQHYDLVLNGYEIAGGSVRIHDGDLQERVLKDILDIPVEPLSHLITALRCGAPPHGGIALGIDRIMTVMANASSIRDVIAFPKTVEGKEPLTGAPSQLQHTDLLYYHLKNSN